MAISITICLSNFIFKEDITIINLYHYQSPSLIIMQENYYIALNGKQEGPLAFNELIRYQITPDTLVWKSGLPEWVTASALPELVPYIIYESATPIDITNNEEKVWFAIINDSNQVGPFTASELIMQGVTDTTPVWRNGMTDWQPLSSQPELMGHYAKKNSRNESFNNNTVPPYSDNSTQYGSKPDYSNLNNNPYDQNPNYNYGMNNGQHPRYPRYDYNNNGQSYHTNWMPWAIGATVVGLLFSCIGAIFGIIAIFQANKANTLYAMGNEIEGERINSNAKTMTIIGYVFAGIGLLTVSWWWGNIF